MVGLGIYSEGRANRISCRIGCGVCERERGGRDDAKVSGLSRWKRSQAPPRGLRTRFTVLGGLRLKSGQSQKGGAQPAPGSGAHGVGCTCWLFHYLLFIGLIGFGHFLIVSCPERL